MARTKVLKNLSAVNKMEDGQWRAISFYFLIYLKKINEEKDPGLGLPVFYCKLT